MLMESKKDKGLSITRMEQWDIQVNGKMECHMEKGNYLILMEMQNKVFLQMESKKGIYLMTKPTIEQKYIL